MRARRASSGRWAALLALAISGAACSMIAGLDGDFHPQEVADAGADAGEDAPVEAGSKACGRTYPDPPNVVDTPVDQSFVLAVRSVDLGEGEAAPPGYDLDHACTCADGGATTCVSSTQHCDAPDGVDTAAAGLFELVAAAVGSASFGSAYFSAKAAEGTWSLLVRVSGWNGTPDDPAVDVAALVSAGAGMTPKWDGSDTWTIASDSVQNGDFNQPIHKSAGAYVSGGVLVASLPDLPIRIYAGTVELELHISGAVLTGTVSGPAGHLQIADGVIAGRWREADVFAMVSSYRVSGMAPICTDSPVVYATLKGAICAGRDILADGNGVASQPCDAISIGIGFKADEALLGAVVPPPIPTPGCPNATDPAHDHCGP